MIDLSCIRNADPELCAAMEQELARQRGNLELIASENITPKAIPASATTAAVSSSTSPKTSRAIV